MAALPLVAHFIAVNRVGSRQIAAGQAIVYFRTIEGHFLFMTPTVIVLETILEEVLGSLKVTILELQARYVGSGTQQKYLVRKTAMESPFLGDRISVAAYLSRDSIGICYAGYRLEPSRLCRRVSCALLHTLAPESMFQLLPCC